ncbi:MAG: DNA-protecting protein DprA [Chitinivibrionales bacterium]|nr:DNA-protecting protein DprA [Chitinivibrionales bacterium]MBD3394392.1 DNA-protecting protein DprA [Chitinivibrionales bacterium]
MSLAWVALNSVKGLGPVRFKHLLERCGSPDAVFKESRSSLSRMGDISDEVAARIRDAQTLARAEEQVNEAEVRGIRILTLADPDYPSFLKEIYAPPPVLFVRGATEAFDKHAVAVVGTRNATHYGEKAAAHLVKELTARGLATVSGLARGIDTCAHRTSLDNGGVTIAVLGSGVDHVYPASNRDLAEHIIENGVVISEFPLKTPPEAYNFPRRNRIISGLAAGVVVVEAGKRSGALITARYALQQGRDVFAVPGSIFSDKSDGTFNLIKSGATPVRSAADIAEVIEVVRHRVPMESVPSATRPPLELLSEAERAVLTHLCDEPLRMDQIVDRTKKVVSELFDILLNLELKGVVKQVAGQQFVRAGEFD